MWLTILALLVSMGYSPLPTATATLCREHMPVVHAKKTLSTKDRIIRAVVKGWKKSRHKSIPTMNRTEYAKVYKATLRKLGKPDESEFLTSMIFGESNGNPIAVNYHPPKILKNGKMSKPLWHCGLTQHQCRTFAECRKYQTDPKYAATGDLRLLRYMDRWRGYKDCSRKCNWGSGPGHERCIKIRANNPFPTS